MPSPESTVTLPKHFLTSTIAPTTYEPVPERLLDEADFNARYEVGETLGEGGMGVVRACNDRRIGREVALKSVHPGAGSQGDRRARFLREACVQGQLEHPAIVPVYDLGHDPGGTLYFTMKRVRGMTFERIVDALQAGDADAARHFSRRKLLAAFASVCQAVHFAHVRGVVHRDLKPGNVMLGDFGEVYVLDWGLAKLATAADIDAPAGAQPLQSGSDPGAKTVHGTTMGTPGYMAPEQVRGEMVDARADVYALGAILFELLALAPLHRSVSAKTAIDSTVAGADARPSVRAPDLEIALELDAICVRATALDPRDRYPDARDIVEALERYLDGDRDLERRRELAREHAHTAQTHIEEALAAGPAATDARVRALQELGRAIALDPANADAARSLVRLLVEPPAEMPAEARLAMVAAARPPTRARSRMASFAYLTWFAYVPFMVWMGVRSWTAEVVIGAAFLVAAIVSYYSSRVPRLAGRMHVPMSIVGMTAVAATSTIFGPYIFVPSAACIVTMLMVMAPDRSRRTLTVTVGVLSVALPAVLQWWGIVPSSYLFDQGTVVIVPQMVSFPPVPTRIFLLAMNVATVLTAGVMMGRFRDTLSTAEERLYVQTWQLRQLVPEQARPASEPPA